MSRVNQYICFVVALCGIAGSSPFARADADEASFHGGLLMGGSNVEMQGIWPVSYIPSAGMSSRLTYATNDWYAYEAGLEIEHSMGNVDFAGPWSLEDMDAERMTDDAAEYVRRLAWMRSDFGIRARLGVQWIPTLYAGMGAQVQWASQVRKLIKGTKPGPERHVALALLGTVAAGLDYRMDEHWVFGTSIRLRHALPTGSGGSYRAVTVYFHIGYYWYPGNMNRDQ